MPEFVVYRTSDGIVLRTGYCGDPDHVDLQAGKGETVDGAAPADVIADGLWQWTEAGYVHNEAPAPTIDQLKAAAMANLADIADVKLNLWESGNLQVDDVSTGRMTSWAAMALVSKATGGTVGLPYWIMADNSHRPFASADDFLAFTQSAAAYKTAAIINNSTLKAAINAAADEAALAAIDPTQGWPA